VSAVLAPNPKTVVLEAEVKALKKDVQRVHSSEEEGRILSYCHDFSVTIDGV
jgi:hypothetical protein